MGSLLARSVAVTLICASLSLATAQKATPSSVPVYRRSDAPIERRIDDLVKRMTLAEKVRQLDLYIEPIFTSYLLIEKALQRGQDRLLLR